MIDLMHVLGRMYPNVYASCSGEPEIYNNIVWEGGDAMPSEQDLIDASFINAQQERWLDIKLYRDILKANGVLVSGYWFHSDDTSRIQQIGLVMLGTNIPAGLQWKTMTGEFVTMTPTLASGIFVKIATNDTQIFSVAEAHRQAMLASSDPENYDYSANWPATFTAIEPA